MSTRTVTAKGLLQGRIFDVERCRWTAADGSEVVRDIVRHPGAVTIVPVLEDGRLVLVRNWRMAVGGPLWEFPAGKREPGESPEVTAARELREETGYTAGGMRPLGQFYTSPGMADEDMHVFEASDLTPGRPQPEAGEELDVGLFALEDLMAMLDRGDLRDGKTLSSLVLWHRSRGTL